MKSGNYVIESIENGLVKLLLSDDEAIEAVIELDQFKHTIKQGDVLYVKIEDGKWTSNPLPVETEKRREQAKTLLEKLKNKNR